MASAPLQSFLPRLGNHDWLTTNAQPVRQIYFTSLFGNEHINTFKRGAANSFCSLPTRSEPDGTSPDSAQGQWLQQH